MDDGYDMCIVISRHSIYCSKQFDLIFPILKSGSIKRDINI